MPKNKKPILNDHARKNNKLVPPLLNALGDKYSPYSWTRQIVPELFWIGIIYKTYGYEEARKICFSLVSACNAVTKNKAFFCKSSSYCDLKSHQKQEILQKIDPIDLRKIREAFSPVFSLMPQSPFQFLMKDLAPTSDDILIKTLNEIYDKYSRLSSLTMSLVGEVSVRMGYIQFPPGDAKMQRVMDRNFTHIHDYPDTELSKMSAGSLRAMIPMHIVFDSEKEPLNKNWQEYFWQSVVGIGSCTNDILYAPYEDIEGDELQNILSKYANFARADLSERLLLWPINLAKVDSYEVITALLARQVSLVVDLSLSPKIWSSHSAPLFLRAMADVFITLSWILGDAEKRAEKFIEDGIGAVKLDIEHRKSQIPIEGEDPDFEKLIDFFQSWINSQRFKDLVIVNLGSWSGISTRKMAEEANCLDFYNYVYQPFSMCTHSNWAHISMHNTVHCTNPAHRGHRMAIAHDHPSDFQYVYLAAKYLKKSFDLFDTHYGIDVETVSAYDHLGTLIDQYVSVPE